MHILIVNSGSSSIKFSLFQRGDDAPEQALLEGEASDLGTGAAALKVTDGAGARRDQGQALRPNDGAEEAGAAIARLVTAGDLLKVDAVGYRVVHPGPKICEHTALTPEVMHELETAVVFAPLHLPAALQLMRTMGKDLPGVPAFCCFDTIFHETMPEEAKTYALPEPVRAQGVRRYGFHGLSCESVVDRLQEEAKRSGTASPRRMVVAHLGSGCSVTAIVDGKSVDTSMGLTPDGGVVMGTRPGDLDPGVVLYLLRQQTGERVAAVGAVEGMLNRNAGVHAVSGMANDMRAVRKAADGGDAKARLAVRVFTRSVQKAIGSYLALMGGLDLLVFTGGIGEHDARSRKEICGGMEELGIALDSGADGESGPADRVLSREGATTVVRVMPAEEDKVIAKHVEQMMGARKAATD